VFVEGETEAGFFKRIAGLYELNLFEAGVEIQNIKGKDTLGIGNLRPLFEQFKREAVFVLVAVNHDSGGNHNWILGPYTGEKLVVKESIVWEPDFELANFTLDELAAIATRVSSSGGVQVRITSEQIEAAMRKGKGQGNGSAGDAVMSL
jgi:hypothetical protein